MAAAYTSTIYPQPLGDNDEVHYGNCTLAQLAASAQRCITAQPTTRTGHYGCGVVREIIDRCAAKSTHRMQLYGLDDKVPQYFRADIRRLFYDMSPLVNRFNGNCQRTECYSWGLETFVVQDAAQSIVAIGLAVQDRGAPTLVFPERRRAKTLFDNADYMTSVAVLPPWKDSWLICHVTQEDGAPCMWVNLYTMRGFRGKWTIHTVSTRRVEDPSVAAHLAVGYEVARFNEDDEDYPCETVYWFYTVVQLVPRT